MKLTLTLAMDNAAFADNPGDEVARILTKLATKVAEMGLESGDGGRLTDINGNAVGAWQVEE